MDRPKRTAWPWRRHPLGAPVPAGQAVGDDQRGEGQRHQRGDPVAHGEPQGRLRARPRLTVPMSMPPDPVTGFCILPRVGHDVEHLGAHRLAVAAVLLGELPERRGVEVERLDGDPHLVGPELRATRRDPRGLRQRRAGRVEDAVQARPGRTESVRRTQNLLDIATRHRRFAAEDVHWERQPVPYPATHERRTIEQPYAYRRRELVEPDWTRLPGWRDVTARGLGQRPVAAGALRQERPAAARADGRPAHRGVLRRPRARPGRAGHDVDARAAADDEHDGRGDLGRRRDADRRRRVHPSVLRRPGAPLHAPGVLRPPHRLAEPPARHARQPARARHVGGRGADPPLPHQGAGRDAADLPAVLRPLHPHGPRRQLDRRSRPSSSSPASRSTGMPRCSTTCSAPRRCATSSSPAATSPTCRGRTSRASSTSCSRSTTSATSGWPPRRSWGCPSTGCRTTSSRAWPACRPRPARAGSSLAIHTHVNSAQSVTPLVADAAKAMLDAGVRDVRNQGVLMRGVNDSTEALLDLCFALQDDGDDHALLLLHVRHDPVQRALAALARRGPAPPARDDGLPARVRDPAHRLRRALRRQALGAPGRRATTPSAGCRSGARTTAPRSRARDTEALSRDYVYYDPIYTLPDAGQPWWRENHDMEAVHEAAVVGAGASHAASVADLG